MPPPPPPPAMPDFEDETASLTDSAKAYSYENGLRYHGYRPGSYSFPNDDTQQESDHCAHVLGFNLCGGYFQSPVKPRLEKGAQVLDLGTGTGTWCEQLADTYPNSSFEGIDLSPIQSPEVPPNVQFYVDDMEHEQGWDFDGRKFDFIFIRNTLNSVRNRPELLRRAYDHLKPGGYFEVQDFDCAAGCDDGSVPGDYALGSWLEYLAAGMAARGSDLFGIRSVAAEMRAAGFRGVTDESRKCPVGEWPADSHRRFCGSLLSHCILTGLPGLSARPFAALGWTPTEVEVFLVSVREHVKTTAFHAYLPYRTVYGRKPR
ncbi:S-adenosyl-L-methionine-dependent methyltransferase [Plectosphaerella cucumerina]|uniref:S-adenosyl-L-methionine-dependent methyltransferase n=1 Tax=Plectosphaerella cucumerina TaxID=40658 RepID=A0A8K0TRH9_9PEZI|nr:S-adenosyl-L-methionine-dependent methyltransferase [Plectosphaerella cucumerina]